MESMCPPFTMLANTWVVSGRAVNRAGHWGPVCSSCRAPEMKTGTLIRVAQLAIERRLNSEGSRPGPVPGATIWGPTSEARESDC